MASTLLCLAVSSLALAPQVAAKGRGGGGGGGGGGGSDSSGSGKNSLDMNELLQVGPWQIARKWVIIGGVVIGIVVLSIVAIILQMCGIFKKLINLRVDKQKARLQQGAHLSQSTGAGGVTHPGQPQYYVEIQPVHGYTPSPWSTNSQQKLPYSQGGLGYTDHSVYHPPTIQVPYSIPYDPPHHYVVLETIPDAVWVYHDVAPTTDTQAVYVSHEQGSPALYVQRDYPGSPTQ